MQQATSVWQALLPVKPMAVPRSLLGIDFTSLLLNCRMAKQGSGDQPGHSGLPAARTLCSVSAVVLSSQCWGWGRGRQGPHHWASPQSLLSAFITLFVLKLESMEIGSS